MAGSNPTQKQIAEKYKGNLDYFRKGHYYRRLRLIAFLIAAVGSIAAVLTFGMWGGSVGGEEVFSTGPISSNHAKFAQDCQACHEGAEPDLLKLQKVSATIDSAKTFTFDKLKAATGDVAFPSVEAMKLSGEKMKAAVNKDKLAALVQSGLEVSSLSNMDRACLKCHEALDLHQPQERSLRMGAFARPASLVHAGACSSCHREHVGHEPMKLPGSESCESCHSDRETLLKTRQLLDPKAVAAVMKVKPQTIPPTGAIVDIGDNLLRFIAPAPANPEPVAFKTYAKGHPPFEYEQPNLSDPAKIKYNHWRHEQQEVRLNGRQLQCADCHKPGPDGVYYEPVNYEQHCATCHSLNFIPEYPDILIPHGRAEHVMDFLDNSSINLKLRDAFIKRTGTTDATVLRQMLIDELGKLATRMGSPEELQKRVFLTGDPPDGAAGERLTPRTNKGKFFEGCAKCHEVSGSVTAGWKVADPRMAERWVHRGPFTHLPHQHMNCADCHAASQSKLTTDILMPKQSLCAECHRPLADEVRSRTDFVSAHADLKPNTPEMAAAQRRDGGVRGDCLTCHSPFHAPPKSLQIFEAASK